MHALEKVAELLEALADERLQTPEPPPASASPAEDPIEKFAAFYEQTTGQPLSDAQRITFRESPELLTVADTLARAKVASSAPPSLGEATTRPGEASHASSQPMTAAERRKIAEEKFGQRMVALGNRQD